MHGFRFESGLSERPHKKQIVTVTVVVLLFKDTGEGRRTSGIPDARTVIILDHRA